MQRMSAHILIAGPIVGILVYAARRAGMRWQDIGKSAAVAVGAIALAELLRSGFPALF
jgi:hypothetical protein